MDRGDCLFSAVVVLPMFLSHVAIRARGDDRPEHSGSQSYNGSRGSTYIGDYCMTVCSSILQHAFCNTTSHRCECSREFPVVIDNLMCEKAVHLMQQCRYDKVCTFSDLNAECRADDGDLSPVCRCRAHYEPTPFQSGSGHLYCVKDPLSELMEPDTPTVLGLLMGLTVMSCLICLVLRLFYRARHARARGYGDASLPPPLSLSEVSTPSGHRSGYHRCSSGPESATWNGHLADTGRTHVPAARLAEPASDSRRLSSGSAHSSFSTCTYGLPESVVTRLKAQQRQSREYRSQQLTQEDDSLDTSSVSLDTGRGRY